METNSMDSVTQYFPVVSAQLTLTKINSCQEEMSYITRMRNVIKFQIASIEDYKCLDYFQHLLLCPWTRISELETCLRHTISKVMKSYVLVHNYTPFRQWMPINIDSNGFSEEYPDQGEELIQRVDEYEEMEHYLVATFKNAQRYYIAKDWSQWNLLQRQLFMESRLDNLQFNNVDSFSSIHQSVWRRLYDNNFTLFFASDANIAAYVKEQTQRNPPIHVFKEIVKRESGEIFNQYGVLETLASPYYYILPHENEENNERIKYFPELGLIFQINYHSYPERVVCSFVSKLSIARKSIARLD